MSRDGRPGPRHPAKPVFSRASVKGRKPRGGHGLRGTGRLSRPQKGSETIIKARSQATVKTVKTGLLSYRLCRRMETIGDRIRSRRRELGLSQRQLAGE